MVLWTRGVGGLLTALLPLEVSDPQREKHFAAACALPQPEDQVTAQSHSARCSAFKDVCPGPRGSTPAPPPTSLPQPLYRLPPSPSLGSMACFLLTSGLGSASWPLFWFLLHSPVIPLMSLWVTPLPPDLALPLEALSPSSQQILP